MLELNIKKKLNNFTLDIECELDSNRIGILGGSGAGKSMILKMLAGIEKPDKGYIKLDDRLLFDSEKKIDIKPKDRNIGYCFQNYALFPNLTVYENIVIGLSKPERTDVDKFLEKFELTKIKDSKPNKISGGQAARVAMARILIRKTHEAKNPQQVLEVLSQWSANLSIQMNAIADMISTTNRLDALKAAEEVQARREAQKRSEYTKNSLNNHIKAMENEVKKHKR